MKDRFRDEADLLTKDRNLTNYRYEASISTLIDQTRALQDKYGELHAFLRNFDKNMASKFIGLSDLEDVIAVGRFGELGKRDTLFLDLEKKAAYIAEIIRQKEEDEVDLAPGGVFNHIYVALTDIQKELRRDIKTFVQHKSMMVQYLEEILKNFNNSIPEFGEQIVDITRETAKDRALECILDTKKMTNKILSETYTAATGEVED